MPRKVDPYLLKKHGFYDKVYVMMKIQILGEEKLPYNVITLVIMAVILVFIGRITYAGLIGIPYPKYPDDTANVALTNAFINELNPYVSESLDWDVPGVNYSHPFLNSLLAVWIVNVFGVAPVNAHFIISLLSILLSGYLGYLIMIRYSHRKHVPFLAGLIFMICHWNKGFISSSPNDLGMFLYILTIYILINDEINHRDLWCAILTTLCFYTMPAYSLVIVPVVIYMFIRSRQAGLKIIGWTVGINALILWFITTTWPLFWTRAFVFPYKEFCLAESSEKLLTLALYTIRLLAPPSAVAILIFIEKIQGEKKGPLDICISSMAVAIVAFIGLFMCPLHILSEDEIDAWNRAYDYTRIYSLQGQVYYARVLAYDKSFDVDNGDCMSGNDEVIRDESETGASVLGNNTSYSDQIIAQNLRYRSILRDMAREHAYKLITLDNGYSVFNSENCEKYGYNQLDRITLRTGNELHEVTFYIPK